MGRVLIIAGSDSGGGAGIQADIKAVTALGGYAATAVTAVTVQNTVSVEDVFPVPPQIVAAQMRAVLDDIGADCIKTGMIADAATIAMVCDVIEDLGVGIPLVVDPVMVATSGATLIEAPAVTLLKERLIPLATLVTPNLIEAAHLSSLDGAGEDFMREAGHAMLELGAAAALIKGGHGDGETVVDLLVDEHGTKRFESPRLDSRNTHGTGCTLASAIAAGLAGGLDLVQSVDRARDYVWTAIETAPGYGRGHGPLNHAHPCDWRVT